VNLATKVLATVHIMLLTCTIGARLLSREGKELTTFFVTLPSNFVQKPCCEYISSKNFTAHFQVRTSYWRAPHFCCFVWCFETVSKLVWNCFVSVSFQLCGQF